MWDSENNGTDILEGHLSDKLYQAILEMFYLITRLEEEEEYIVEDISNIFRGIRGKLW